MGWFRLVWVVLVGSVAAGDAMGAIIRGVCQEVSPTKGLATPGFQLLIIPSYPHHAASFVLAQSPPQHHSPAPPTICALSLTPCIPRHPAPLLQVFQELPLEFAAEVNELMSLKLEGSVG